MYLFELIMVKKIKASAICSAPTTFDFNDYYLKFFCMR